VPNLDEGWPPKPLRGLKEFQFALLVLFGSPERTSPSDIERLIESRLGGVLGRSASHVYNQCKVLAEQGYLEPEPQQPESRARTVYRLTRKGELAAHVWLLRGPADLPATDDSQVFVRLRGARFASPEMVWKGLESLWLDVAERLAVLDQRQLALRRDGDWDAVSRLEVELSRKLLRAYDEWFAEVAREWAMPDPRND
jgi:DNA-binding PadR family transcriptional regulator